MAARKRAKHTKAGTSDRAVSGETKPGASSSESPEKQITPGDANAVGGESREAHEAGAPAATESKPPEPWHVFVRQAAEDDIRDRFIREAHAIIRAQKEFAETAALAIFRPDDSISSFDLDQVYEALMSFDPDRYKDIVLFLLSRGGEIEPAYQISKLCRTFARQNKFLVVVPRYAKSAATLIALGADEIHVGPLGQLGPIDPQIGGLPALGVSQALKTIAALVQQYPKSAEMFAQYLRLAVKVEHIGYSDRVAESAVQYAERLLVSKAHLASRAPEIARQLVYTYKDHSFVIDAEEAQRILGTEWVKVWSPIETVAERLYSLFDWANLWLSPSRKKRLVVTGAFDMNSVFLFNT